MPTWTWGGQPIAISGGDDKERIRQANLRADREKAKAAYWQEVATARGDGLNAGRVADEIMARIERDGAIHRDALIEVVQIFGRREWGPYAPVTQDVTTKMPASTGATWSDLYLAAGAGVVHFRRT